MISGKHKYITMLRDPVNRIVSEYYYCKNLGERREKLYEASLEEHVDRYSTNLQTFMLAGERSECMFE